MDFSARLARCAKSADALGAKAVFRELRAICVPCTPDMCAILMHIFCDAITSSTAHHTEASAHSFGRDESTKCANGAEGAVAGDLRAEALTVFEAVKSTGCVPGEPAWSGLVKIFCLHGQGAQALAHVDTMVAVGVAPRLRTLAPILAVACFTNDRALAAESVQRLSAAGLGLGVRPRHSI